MRLGCGECSRFIADPLLWMLGIAFRGRFAGTPAVPPAANACSAEAEAA
jgi:hypothetical protein